MFSRPFPGNDARGLLTAEKTLTSSTDAKITWIGSDKWFTDPEIDVTSGLEDIARGAIVVTNYIVDFDPLKKHLSNLGELGHPRVAFRLQV